MTGIPEYGTGRHEDYLSQQDERAEQARDQQAEQDHAEWLDWMDSEGYAASQRQGSEGYGGGDMFDAFKAGMQAARDLAAAKERPASGDVRGLLDPLHALAAKWDANAARNQRNGQSLLDQGDEYGSEGLAVAEALGACVVDLRAVLADAPLAHREKGSPA